MERPATHDYEVSAPDGEVLGLVRAPSAGRALRRIKRAVWRALHGAGSAGVLCRAAPARLRRAMAGPKRAAVRESAEPDDPELRPRGAGRRVRRSCSTLPGSPNAIAIVTRPSHSSTDFGTSLSEDLWVSLVCSLHRSPRQHHKYTVPSRSLVSVTVSIRPAAVFFAPRKSKLACTPPGPSTASLGLGR